MFLMSSCSSFINNYHQSFRKEEQNKYARRMYYNDQRKFNNGSKNKIRDPKTLRYLSQSGINPNLSNEEKSRDNYLNMRSKKKDLVDNDKNLSLWNGNNRESFLFVTNNLKSRGDIVIINVEDNLDKKIESEIRSTLPKKRPNSKSANKQTQPKPPAKNNPQSSTAQKGQPSRQKIVSKISTQVINEINNEYLLVRGRKEVGLEGVKRYIEFQGLISQKDIDSQDVVLSNKVLEPKVDVLKY